MDSPRFVDIFAGAGGLSLGLLEAGWTGLFAIEKSSMAFETLDFNLVDTKDEPKFNWPSWFPREAISIEDFLVKYDHHLHEINNLPLLAGGPPCQGFSLVGRREIDDERNRLFEQYLVLVSKIKPLMLLVENVRGFAIPFKKKTKNSQDWVSDEEVFNAAEKLQKRLGEMGYTYFVAPSVMAKDFGVMRPENWTQNRSV